MGVIEQVMQTASAGERIGLTVRDVAGGKLAISLSGRYILEMPDNDAVIINGSWHDREDPEVFIEAEDGLFARYRTQ